MEDIVFEVEHLDSTTGSGVNGWSPALAVAADGERRVLEVIDWFGGGGTKPAIGQYLGATGLVDDISQAIDIRGAAGSGSGDAATLNGQGPTYYLSRTNHTGTQAPATIAQDTSNRFVTDAEKTTWNGKQNALGFTPVATDDARLSDARTPLPHQHAMTDVTGLSTALSGKADSSTVTAALADKADADSVYTKTEADALLSGKAATVHTHEIAQVNGLQSALDAKADSVDVYTKTEVDSAMDLKVDAADLVPFTGAALPGDISSYPDGKIFIIG